MNFNYFCRGKNMRRPHFTDPHTSEITEITDDFFKFMALLTFKEERLYTFSI
jgi:hypothetical protein